MHKYVGVYIVVLMYISSSMCYLRNIFEILKIKKKKKKKNIPYIYICNEMDANFQHMY